MNLKIHRHPEFIPLLTPNRLTTKDWLLSIPSHVNFRRWGCAFVCTCSLPDRYSENLEQCLVHRSCAIHCCWMNAKRIQGPLWSSPFLLSPYTIHYSLAWSWFSVWIPLFSSKLENPTDSLVFGSSVTIFMKPSMTLPASHQNFFLCLWDPKVLCL